MKPPPRRLKVVDRAPLSIGAEGLLSNGEPVTLAGDFPLIEYENGNTTVRFSSVGDGRVCGSCQLCCKLVPVPVIEKPAGKRCRHARTGKGCMIYDNRPFDCRSWSCRWLADRANTDGMQRPDRSHFVIDMVPDKITRKFDDPAIPDEEIGVIQVWIDPAFPETLKSPELRRYMAHIAEKFGYPTLVRFNSRDAICVFPPVLAHDRQWHEMSGNVTARDEWQRMLMDNWEVETE